MIIFLLFIIGVQRIELFSFQFFRIRVFFLTANNLVLITTPLSPEALSEMHPLHPPALSPKIALSQFFFRGRVRFAFRRFFFQLDITFFTSAPSSTIPFSSRSLVAYLLTLGISRVSSSSRVFVSRTWSSNSSYMNRSKYIVSHIFHLRQSRLQRLYPLQGIKATETFRPRANSPLSMAGPSARTSPFFQTLTGNNYRFFE